MKTIFENSGGTYTQVGDYLFNLSLLERRKRNKYRCLSNEVAK